MMSAPKTHLRLANSSPPHVRAQLFAAIAKVREAEERLAKNNDKIGILHERTYQALHVVDAAEAAIAKAKEAQLEYLASDSPEPATTAREARQKRDEAEANLSDLRAARAMAEATQKGLESEVAIAKMCLSDAIAEVVKDDPAVKRLCEKFAELSRSYIDM